MSEKQLLSPQGLKEYLKSKKHMENYLNYLRGIPKEPVSDTSEIRHPNPKYHFMFHPDHRYLNFHPDLEPIVRDLLEGKVERKYEDIPPDIAVHDYIGHMASSQAYCWNIVLPMKRHDNFAPLFDTLNAALQEGKVEYSFDFGVETAVVLEMNVSQDLGEGKLGTSIDLYLRTQSGMVCAMEFKLTEPDFGQCSQPRDGKCDGHYGSRANCEKNEGYLCYLAKIGRRYWRLGAQYYLLDPTFVSKDVETDPIKRCPLNVFYQPLRNLMVAKKRSNETVDGPVRGIFVLVADKRNKAFWGNNNHFDRFKKYLATARKEYNKKDVFRISTQDIVGKFLGKFSGSLVSGSLASYREFYKVKYDL